MVFVGFKAFRTFTYSKVNQNGIIKFKNFFINYVNECKPN